MQSYGTQTLSHSPQSCGDLSELDLPSPGPGIVFRVSGYCGAHMAHSQFLGGKAET